VLRATVSLVRATESDAPAQAPDTATVGAVP
jgi:hypothetical protein